jgi:S-adenosylmethionine synthetase
MAVAVIDGVEEDITGFDLTPLGIRTALKLDSVKYVDTCTWGHFGQGFEWDK